MTERGEQEWTIERHLAGQPQPALDLYRKFIHIVEGIGPFTYAVGKSSITLKGERRGFAGIRPCRDGVRGYLDLQRELRDPRITSVGPLHETTLRPSFPPPVDARPRRRVHGMAR